MDPARQLSMQSSRCAWLIDDNPEGAVEPNVDEIGDGLVKNPLVDLATCHQQVTSLERVREYHEVHCVTHGQGTGARSSTDS